MNDKYVINRLSEYRPNPKYNFLGMMESNVAFSKPLVTAKLHDLPVVPLSKPLVVSTGTSPTDPKSCVESKKNQNDSLTTKKGDGFTMSQSWPVTVEPLRTSLQGINFIISLLVFLIVLGILIDDILNRNSINFSTSNHLVSEHCTL